MHAKILSVVALLFGLQAQSPTPAPAPWQPRPVIIIDPRPYLSSPSPQPAQRAPSHTKQRAVPHARATPAHRRPATTTPETFERLDTSPSPGPRRA